MCLQPVWAQVLIFMPKATSKPTTEMRKKMSKAEIKRINKLKGIPYAVFARLVKELTPEHIKWKKEAMGALKEECEKMVQEKFESAAERACMCKVETVTPVHLLGVK